MRYDIAGMARRAGVRRKRIVLRPIKPTMVLKQELRRLLNRIPQAWHRAWQDRIKALYGVGLDQLTRDDMNDDMAEALRAAEEISDTVIVEVSADIAEWIRRLEEWHRRRWSEAVRAGTTVDIFPFLDTREYEGRIQAMLEEITSLVRSLNEQMRADLAQTVWRGFRERTPRRQIASQIAKRLDVARRRARNIAIDQTQKIAAELSRLRQKEAGITKFMWRHSGKVNYRVHHKAREGQIYEIGEPAGDEPGMAPFCGCQGMAVIEIA